MEIKSVNWYAVFLHIMVILLGIIVVLLAKQNIELKEAVRIVSLEQVETGQVYEELNVVDGNGNDHIITFKDNERNTLLFVFSTECPYCTNSLPIWKQIYYKNKSYFDVISISISPIPDTEKYIDLNKILFRTYFPKDENFRKDYKIKGVPQTILIDTKGAVERVKPGELKNDFLFVFQNEWTAKK